MFNSIGDILELLVNRDWDTFRSTVLSSHSVFRHLASAISSCSQLNGMTLLHAAVRYNPPLDVIEQMIEYCPTMPAARDVVNRTPLHVAAGSGASAGLLNIIARANPEACDVQDEGGKTPLHFVCDSSAVLFEDDQNANNNNNNNNNRRPNHDAISTLLSYSFHASILRDDEEMSPREHAIRSNASGRTVSLLYSCQGLARRHQQQQQQQLQQQRRAARADDDVDTLVISVTTMSVSERSNGSNSNSTLRTGTVRS